jgi:peptidoglycan/LPS O-acetylase OafA/YrhL
LQAGRGLAALAVVLHHAEQSIDRLVGGLPSFISVPFEYGYLGVDFFFVLSGFIIYYVSHARVEDPHWPHHYLESRLTRVFLPYLPIGIAVALAYLAMPSMGSGLNDWNWVSTLTLLPSDGGPALSVAWTLQHEIAFYAVAFVFLYLRKVLLGCVIGGAVAIAYSLINDGGFKAFSLIDLEFIFGIFAAWCFIHGRLRYGLLLPILGITLCAMFFIVGSRHASVLFGLGISLVLLPIVRAEAAGHLKIGTLLTLLGDASYSIYLIHHPLMSVVVRALTGFPVYLALALTVLASIAAGLAYHFLCEKRIISAGRRVAAHLGQRRRRKPA